MIFNYNNLRLHSKDIWGVVIHWTDSPPSTDLGTAMEAIHKDHLSRGWNGFGYHYIINKHGSIGYGRPLQYRGAHVSKRNDGLIGIALQMRAGGVPTYSQAAAVSQIMCDDIPNRLWVNDIMLELSWKFYTHCSLSGTDCGDGAEFKQFVQDMNLAFTRE